MRTLVCAVVLALFALSAVPAFAADEYDDCDANFAAFIGSSVYRFSPNHEGELGTARLFSILSYQRAAHAGRYGFAVWKLEIERVDDDAMVLTVRGRARIDTEGAALAELYWDGRDDAGHLVPAGKYRYTFRARYLPDLRSRTPLALDYEWLQVENEDEAQASSDDVIVDYDLTPVAAEKLRVSANATSCQIQQNASIEPGFGFNFYYGSTHSHSNWSDGGQPTTNCTSGSAYGTGTFTPADVFAHARDSSWLDFWVVNEHNHLISDAIGNNNAPITEAKVRQRYQDGIAAANAATTATFVGLYGMEWGVSTNADQGHLTLIETPSLFGWKTCTTCNGPNPECTPGVDCYFDVFTPKRFGYLTLYARSVENPSSVGALGIFNHPGSGNFDDFAFDANADDAMQGIAVRSGLAFSTATDCSTANVGATDYSSRWRTALDRGFHVAPVADHDSHCNNFGQALPTRTVYLAPSLSKTNLMAAHRARHFYAAEDSNLQLVFRTSDGTRIMGDIFSAAGGATLVANVYDPDTESTSTMEIWRGQIGAGAPTVPFQTWSNVSSISMTETLTSGTYWYYVHIVQADGHDAWSAPMWITYGPGGGGGDTTAPTTSITAPSGGATVSGTTLVTAAASDNIGVTAVEFYLDGALQSTDTTAPYEWNWNTTSTSNASHSLQSRARDAASNVGVSSLVTVTVSNGAPTGGADVSGWKLTQTNSTGELILPGGTIIPDGGYLVVARNTTQAAFETFWARTLGANVVFVNSVDKMPVINGSENYSLYNAALILTDGPTISMGTSGGQSIQRTDLCASASLTASWSVAASSTGTPGTGAAAGSSCGVRINEFSDALGTGNFIYEFIELHNDAAVADTTAPTTSITAPAGGATVSGTTTVTASATDNVGVTSVEFYLDGALASTDTTSPYQWSWNTMSAANGTHSLTSKAYDAASNVGTSSAINVTVSNDTTAPSTSITAPAGGATVSGTTTVTASATDNVGVTSVEFYLDGALAATDTTSPYQWSWNTISAANGSHALTSKAYDAASNVGTSSAVNVTVSNDTTAPTTSITAPAGGATVSGTTTVTASATDNVGVTSVEFYLDGALAATDTTSPYQWSWNTISAANGSHSLTSKAYDAVGNVGTSAAAGVTVNNVTGTSVAGYRIVQAASALTYYLPAGTVIPSKGYVIIGRNATQAQFEMFWGITLGANVVYINAADAMPQINGSETFTLYNASSTKIDGVTVAMASAGNESLRRTKPCSGANKAASWSRGSASLATPGSGAPAVCGKGIYIAEFSDAIGTGNFIYEFVELYNEN